MQRGAATKPSSRREREAARRRAEILDAATRLFAERGYEGTPISAVARSAEVSLATLYALFPSKDELYQAVFLGVAESVRDAVRGRVERIADPAERLLELVDGLLQCFEDNRALMRIYALGTQGLPWSIRPAMGEPVAAIYREFLEYATGLARAAADAGRLGRLPPESVAYALVGAINTTAAEWIESGREAPLRDAAPDIRAVFERILVAGGDS